MITITDAIRSLTTDASFTVIGDEITWFSPDITQPTQSEIDAEIARLQAEYDSQAYARTRADAYPTVSDFMEAYTEKEIGSSSTKWDAYVTAYNKVRSDNPKP